MTTPPAHSTTTTVIQLSEHSWLEYSRRWLPFADAIYAAIADELTWTREPLTMWGRAVHQPRLTAICGRSMDPASRYRTPRPDQPWTSYAAHLRDAIADSVSDFTPNGLIANWYRDGNDSIAWHADDEPALGPNPTVASLSLGADRRLKFRAATGGPAITHLDLGHGDLLVMRGACQTEYQHAITKTSRPTAPRISLTLRDYG